MPTPTVYTNYLFRKINPAEMFDRFSYGLIPETPSMMEILSYCKKDEIIKVKDSFYLFSGSYYFETAEPYTPTVKLKAGRKVVHTFSDHPAQTEAPQYLTHSQKEKIFSNVAEHSQYTIKSALDSLRYKYLNNTSQWTESDYRQFAREQVNATLLKVVAEQMESQSKMNS